jgi:hypothetical protein
LGITWKGLDKDQPRTRGEQTEREEGKDKVR